MPAENSQALPVEEVQVQETTPAGETPVEPQTEKPLTLEDVRKLMRDEITPIIQSQVAKGENRIEKRIQERFAALEENKSTLKLTDDQVAEAKRAIISEEQMNAYSPAQSPTGEAAAPAPELELEQMERFVANQIEATFQEVGVRVTPDDVDEFKTINAAWNDPNGSLAKTLIAVTKAAEAKAARLALQKQNAAARVVSGGAESTSDPNNISNITDAKTLYRMGEAKLSKRK